MDQMRNQGIEDDDLDRPNQASNKDLAEGSRENAGGITNRPLDREIDEQDAVPPRGESKDEEDRD